MNAILPQPHRSTRDRSQLEAFLVLRRNPLELWGPRAYREDIIPGRFLGRPQLLVNAPDAIRHVLISNADNYTRNVATTRVLRPVLGDGLFLAEGAKWRHQRRSIAPALAPRSMPLLARHVVHATEAREQLLATLTHRPIELMPHLQQLALAIAGRSMFSLEMQDHGATLRAMLTGYAAHLARPGLLDLLLPPDRPSPQDRKRAAFRRDWLAFIGKLIDLRSNQPAPEHAPRDLFDLLSAARDPETGDAFTRAQLSDEIATMIVAGHETTAVTLFWALYLAARFPGHQQAMADQAAAADLSPDQAAHSLDALPLLRAHIDETLRLYPPAFLIVRQALAPDTLAGHRIDPGCLISISPWLLHRHHRRWTAPDTFDPSRFLPGAAPPERFSYLPFGAGPRICVGAQFALTEAILVLGRLLRRFRISLAGPDTIRPRGMVTTQPDRPAWFLLTPR